MQKRDAICQHPSSQQRNGVSLLLPGEQLLEQVKRAGIVRLSKPEERFLPYFGIFVRSGHCDERRDSLFTRTLGQSEYGLFAHFAIDAVVQDNVVQIAGRRFSRGLTEPEY